MFGKLFPNFPTVFGGCDTASVVCCRGDSDLFNFTALFILGVEPSVMGSKEATLRWRAQRLRPITQDALFISHLMCID